MTRLFLECTVRAALIVLGTAIVLYAMRVKVASVKHRVWTAVLLLMLALPFWIVWGPKAPIRILPANVENFAAEVFVQSPAPAAENAQRANSSQTPATPEQRVFSTTEEVLLGLYLLGTFVFLARLAIGTAKANQLVREAPVIDGLCTSESCAAPVTVGCFRPTIVLPANWRDWSEARLGVVLAHEREHVRRRDPLVQWLALLNRAVFWFHPAAWWLERELSALAEECCDAAVLAQGHDPEAYAETLMHMARAVMDSGTRVNVTGSAMPGVRLPERIRSIIEERSVMRISPIRAACTIAACVAICAAFFCGALTGAQTSDLLAWEQAAGGKMAFEVASVKQNKAGVPPLGAAPHTNVPLGPGDEYAQTGGFFSATNFQLQTYIQFAYKLQADRMLSLYAQLPEWVKADRFDIQARSQGSPTKDQVRLMMQRLLADHFKLAIHGETQTLPVFGLVMVRGKRMGPQLRRHLDDPPCVPSSSQPPAGQPVTITGGFPASCGGIVRLPPSVPGRMRLGGRNVSLALIGHTLRGYAGLDRPVLEQAGMSGNFDFVIEWIPDSLNSQDPQSNDSGPTFLEALRDQLGLKLESTTGPVDTIVLDHVEEPTAS